MIDIDKAVELARAVLGNANAHTPAAITLARAVLAMAAVVVAARAWVAADDAFWRGEGTAEDVEPKAATLVAAVRTLDAEARRG